MEQVKVSKEMDRETLIDVARTSLRTKVHAELADVLTEVCVRCGVCLVQYTYTEDRPLATGTIRILTNSN